MTTLYVWSRILIRRYLYIEITLRWQQDLDHQQSQILVIHGWGMSCEIALIWMSLDFTDDQSTLVQVMIWCHQATSHYLSQCWPRFLSTYSVTRPGGTLCFCNSVSALNLQNSLCVCFYHSMICMCICGRMPEIRRANLKYMYVYMWEDARS